MLRAGEGCGRPGPAGARRRGVLVGMAAAGAVPAGALWAAASAPSSTGQWLDRIRGAAANRSYQGTTTYTAGGTVSSSRIAHYCDGRERFERVEGLDGQVRRQYRHNDQVVTLWPATRVAVVEQHDVAIDFPALPPAPRHIAEPYELQPAGVERVCGFAADVLLFKPVDAHRFAQRLWAERDSGLLLRADTLGAQGEVLETSTFTEVMLAPKPQPESVRAPMKRLEGWKVVRPKVVKTRLDAEGWTLAAQVPGFEAMGCSRRPLDSSGGGAAADAQTEIVQAVFCDGLTQVSVFVEPYDAHRHRPVRQASGATHTTMSRRGNWWLTVMGEVPMATVALFEAALERRS